MISCLLHPTTNSLLRILNFIVLDLIFGFGEQKKVNEKIYIQPKPKVSLIAKELKSKINCKLLIFQLLRKLYAYGVMKLTEFTWTNLQMEKTLKILKKFKKMSSRNPLTMVRFMRSNNESRIYKSRFFFSGNDLLLFTRLPKGQ